MTDPFFCSSWPIYYINVFLLHWKEIYLLHPQTHQVLELLSKFENGVGRQMDLTQKYLVVLQRYECDLEFVRKLYQREKNNPSSAQFKTPVSSLLSDNQTAQLYFIFQMQTCPQLILHIFRKSNTRKHWDYWDYFLLGLKLFYIFFCSWLVKFSGHKICLRKFICQCRS